MSDTQFVPNYAGYNEVRNSSGVQGACLKVAQNVAAIAGGVCECAFSCDVRAGQRRCHARASIAVPFEPDKYYYGKKYPNVKKAMANAASSVGGKASIGSKKGGKK